MAEEKAPAAEAQKKVPERYELVADYPPKGGVTRRNFLMSWAGAAWGTFALAGGAGTMAMLRFMLPNVLFEPPQVFMAGKLEDYEFDKPDERFKDKKTWIVKLTKDFNGKKVLIALDTTPLDSAISNWFFDPAIVAFPLRHDAALELLGHQWARVLVTVVACGTIALYFLARDNERDRRKRGVVRHEFCSPLAIRWDGEISISLILEVLPGTFQFQRLRDFSPSILCPSRRS